MSSSTLTAIQTRITLYGNSIILSLGNIGNIFLIIIFSRYRQSPCSMYLLSSAIINIIFLTFACLTIIFPFYYADETMRAFALCKIRAYVLSVLGPASRTMLVLACIDRFLVTDDRVSFRAFSTPKRAKYLIFFSCIFWSLFVIHAPIMITVINGQCISVRVYTIIFTVYTLIFVCLIPSTTLGVVAYLTYRNLKQRHVRVQAVTHDVNNVNNNIQRRDHALLIIVISEVLVYVVTTMPYPLILIETMISGYIISNKSVQYLQIESFISSIINLLLYMNNAAPFYIYLISSKSFRRDFKQLIINNYWKLRGRTPVVEIVSRTDRALAQRDTRV
jgi:hypothetical protein